MYIYIYIYIYIEREREREREESDRRVREGEREIILSTRSRDLYTFNVSVTIFLIHMASLSNHRNVDTSRPSRNVNITFKNVNVVNVPAKLDSVTS